MTKQEYEALYRSARASFIKLDLKMKKQIRDVYLAAAEQVAAEVKIAELAQAAELTVDSRLAIYNELKRAADQISREMETMVPDAVSSAYMDTYADIDKEYVLSASVDSGAVSRIAEDGLERIAAGVNNGVVKSVTSRIYQNGYTLSQTIWADDGLNGVYQKNIKDLISTGLAQGRDPVKIARDIQKYTKDGLVKMVKTWGLLKRGIPGALKRIPKTIDYRAMRIMRSEIYAGTQTAAAMQGQANPASVQEYNWIMAPGQQHVCVCPELAAGSPYTQSAVPAYPHPNCLCRVVPILRDRREFVDDLKRWVDGENVPYLQDWYNKYYLNS